MPRISVLMPVYNTKESYLREAIESILNQTFTDFELLILNDGSTNNAREVVLSYNDERIKYQTNEQNMGLPRTRNKMFEYAKGEFIAIMDSDDISLPNRFEEQVKFFEENPEVGVVGSWFEIFPDRGITQNPPDDETIKKKLLFEYSVIGNSTAMIRNSILQQYQIRYPVDFKSAEDYAFWLSLVDKTKFANIQKNLLRYRWHEQNMSKTGGNTISIYAQRAMFEAQSKYFNLDASGVMKIVRKLEADQKITSAELMRLNVFASKVIENIKKSNIDCDYQFNRNFHKLAFRMCKKDKLYFKILFNKIFKKQNFYAPETTKIIKFKGGLGNQMFQYAYGKAIEHYTGETVLFDNFWFEICKSFKNCTAREYEMDKFAAKINYSTREQSEICSANIKYDKSRKNYNKNLMYLNENVMYEGYFQGEELIKEIRQDLIEDFRLKEELDEANKQILEQIKSTNSVSLHVRRGDYLKYEEAHGLCSLEYYKKAIEYIIKKFPDVHFFMFSDDIDWVVENLKISYPYTIVDINKDKSAVFDLELMKNCKHNILANSSFSWWGAWLNENSDKIVIAPKKWFADKKIADKHIIPKNFLKF